MGSGQSGHIQTARHAHGMKVAVVGAGIAGLATALVLAQRGAKVTILERADTIRAFGAGIQLGPNAMRALNAMGVDISRTSVLAEMIEPMDAITGRKVAQFDVGQYKDAPYRFAARSAVINQLHEACLRAGVIIRTRQQVTVNRGIPLVGDKKLLAQLIIGAGGLHCNLRGLLNDHSKPYFTNQVAWRAMINAHSCSTARVWMGPGRHVVTYPVGGGVTNVVAVQERREWAAEGWSHEDDPDNLRHVFSRMAPELRSILDRVEKVNLWGLFRHDVADHWYGAHIALVGDAAHPTLPFLAQGANLALEDACILARCVDELGIEAGLPRYQQLRKDRATRAINAANANGRNFHLRGPAKFVAHNVLRAISNVAPHSYLKRLDWLYRYDVTKVAV